MKRNVRNTKVQTPNTSKGITLVALVITIIVLLILAGVAINMAINSDGLFGKANEATEKWNESVEKEETAIGELLTELENLSPTPDISGANGPKVPSDVKVKYVTWVEDETVDGKYNEILSDTRPENWHNYNEKRWANIKTIATTAKEDGTYNSAYWVWIPRYAYQIPAKPTEENSTGNPPEFKIAFLEGTSNTPVDANVLNGATIKTDTSSGVNVGDWVVHPAFQFGNKQLSGIWVAKYEASSSNPNATYGGGDTTELQVQVLPNVPSWRYITLTNAFAVCQNMTTTTGALEGNNISDPHLMKNVEWGAIVYLSQSKYGKNTQVWNNPYWDEANSAIVTGKVAKTSTATKLADAKSEDTTEYENYSEGNGVEGSTTGNVYGVYDMAGGGNEYVAAYLNNDNASSNTDITNLYNAEEKYKDVYVSVVTGYKEKEYLANANKYGDAIYETSYSFKGSTSWQGDISNFPGGQMAFVRGRSLFGWGYNRYVCIYLPYRASL